MPQEAAMQTTAIKPPSASRAITLTARQVHEFACKARWEVHCEDTRANRSRCLDGRYKPGAGVIAMPGADAGLLAIGLIGARWIADTCGRAIDDNDLTALVLRVVGGKPNFSFHTDRASLAIDAHRLDGCSYCRLLATSPDLFEPYPLDNGQVAALGGTLASLELEHVKPDILRGGHDECVVLIAHNVRSLATCEPLSSEEIDRSRRLWVLDNYAVLRGTGRRRAFVYQEDLAQWRVDALADALARSLALAPAEGQAVRGLLQEVGELHASRTLAHLAPALPVYDIFIDARTGEVAEPELRR
jgi:hypothetical protein